MKTLLFILAAFLASCLPTEARDNESLTISAYESAAIAKARQRPDVIKLRFALAKASTEAERAAISATLYDIIESAAATGRQQGLLAIEASRRRDAELHAQWDAERRHEELILTLQGYRINPRP